MPLAAMGNLALVFAILTTIYAMVLGTMGVKQQNWNYKQSAQGANTASLLLTLMSSLILWHALLQNDFSFSYVANYSKISLPWYYKLSAFWAGQGGSLLFWILCLSFVAWVVQKKIPSDEAKLGIASFIHGIRLAFFFILLSTTPPFLTLARVPLDGAGLNPLLQSFGMIIHPPITFLSFALFTVPWAIVLYALYAKTSLNWGSMVRPYLLAAWFFLTAGIITGGQWAYTELGWGGYWAWDPVENASLFPWLTSTILLHTLLLQRRNRGYEAWNFLFITLSFALCIFGTFITRSGIVDSVHAFGNYSVGPMFLALIGCILGFSLYTFFRFRRTFQPTKSVPLFSLEGALRVSGVFFFLILLGVLLGTMYPVFSDLLTGTSIALQESFYNQVSLPFWFGILLLMGLSPLLPWYQKQVPKKAFLLPLCFFILTPLGLRLLGITDSLALFSFSVILTATVGLAFDSLRNKKRRLIHLIHFSILLMAFGITGGIFDEEVLVSVDPSEQVVLNNYTFLYSGLEPIVRQDYTHIQTTLAVFSGEEPLGTLMSEKIFHPSYRQPASNVGVMSTLKGDLYFNLAGWEHDTAFLHLSLKPLVPYIWLGSYLLYGATLLLFLQR